MGQSVGAGGSSRLTFFCPRAGIKSDCTPNPEGQAGTGVPIGPRNTRGWLAGCIFERAFSFQSAEETESQQKLIHPSGPSPNPCVRSLGGGGEPAPKGRLQNKLSQWRSVGWLF
jgi:hypothetical protein